MGKLSDAFKIDEDRIRIREFEYHGQTFKVRVPKSTEAEEMAKRVDNPSKEAMDNYFESLSKELYAKRKEIEESGADIKFNGDDVIVGENSLRDLARSQASTDIRILESIKLLVPMDGTTLGDITYADIEAEFPKPIQISLVKKIAEIISAGYDDLRKN
jgi:hypothetical protein